MCICYYRVDAWEWRIRYKCLGPVEWRPDVDGKMGKNWIPWKQLTFCSLLILVGATKHDNGVGDFANMVWLNITLFSNFLLSISGAKIGQILFLLSVWSGVPRCSRWSLFPSLPCISGQSIFIPCISSLQEASVSSRAWVYCFSNWWPRLLAPSPSSPGTVVYQLLCGAEAEFFV